MRRPRVQAPKSAWEASDLAIRQLIDCSDGRRLRVIDVLPDSQELVLFDIHAKDAQPRCLGFDDVDEQLDALRWTPIASTQEKTDASDDGRVSAETPDDPFADGRWKIFSKHGRNRALYEKRTRGAAIERIAAACKCSTKHVRETLRLAWRGGMTRDCLRSNVHKRGRRSADGKPRGRKPTKADYRRYAWPDDAYRARVQKFAVKTYMKSTLDDTYTQVKKKFFFEKVDGVRRELLLGDCPTKRQISTLVDKGLTAEEKSIRSFGVAQHELQFDPRVGSVHDACRGPGDVFEIDASQVDVWLLSREKGKVRHVIGKATMYLVVDRYSRLIVGFYVSLDPPSWAGAMRAILSIFEDKNELCRRHGIAYDPKDWIAHGHMPNRFFADRGGEFTGHNSELIIRNLHVIVSNAKALWAAAKGTVECSFKLVHVELKRDKIGHDPAYNRRVRRAAKTHKSAKLTIMTLRRRLLKAVLAHNRKPHKDYQLPPEGIRDGHRPIPRDIYARGLKKYGAPSFFEESEVLRSLLSFSAAPPKADKTNKSPDHLESGGAVRKNGIRFGCAMYSSRAIIRAGWLLRAKQGDAFRVHVRHDPGLVDYIYVIDPDHPENEYPVAMTSDYERHYSGYTRYELLNLVDVRKENDFWDEQAEESARLARAVENDEEPAEPPQKVVKGKKGPEYREKDKRADRSDSRAMPPTEADLQDQETAVLESAEAAPTKPANAPTKPAPASLTPPAPAAGISGAALNRLMRNLKGKS